MDFVGQMYKLSACFDTPSEYKGLPYDYFPEEAVSYGSTICSFGLPYNDHNYGMPVGLTPPAMAPHLMDPVPKPKKPMSNINPQWTRMESKTELALEDVAMIKTESDLTNHTDSSNALSNNHTPRKQYLDENDYPVYVEPEIKVVEVPSNLCLSPSEYSECSTDSSDEDDVSYNPDFILYLKQLPKKHASIDKYLSKAKGKHEQYTNTQKSSCSERRDVNPANDFIIDCICEFNYDDKRMVQCESCGVRQHIDCMYTNPRQVQNFLKHRCHKCSDISVDISRAKAIQQSRKNWHTTADRMASQKSKYNKVVIDESIVSGTPRRPREFMLNFREIRTDRRFYDGSKSHKNSNLAVFRVNKRKQDLKACMASETVQPHKAPGTNGSEESSVSSINSREQDNTNNLANETGTSHPIITTTTDNASEQETSQATSTPVEQRFNSSNSNTTPNNAIYQRRSYPLKKDYKEATKSLYSTKLLDRVKQMTTESDLIQNNRSEQSDTVKQVSTNEKDADLSLADQGSEFLDRNPRCRIVLFDSQTRGIEASVKIQSGSIVSALIGKMMLMDEYLACTNPTTEFRPYVFLYHNFADNGIAIDCSNYGNITRYLRRSCDPNVKLDHMVVGGALYVVIRTTTEIYQGVELTMPFDVPFEICQYSVLCACGKVRCPAIKHRRKHHRAANNARMIAASNINCEQVIEDKLRELSQPLLSGNSPNNSPQHPNQQSGSNSVSASPINSHLKFANHLTPTGNNKISSSISAQNSPGMVVSRFGLISRPSITACLEYARSNKRNNVQSHNRSVAANAMSSHPLAKRLFNSKPLPASAMASIEDDQQKKDNGRCDSPSELGSPDKVTGSTSVAHDNVTALENAAEIMPEDTTSQDTSNYTPNKDEEPISLAYDGIKTEELDTTVPCYDEEEETEPEAALELPTEMKLEPVTSLYDDDDDDTDSVKTNPSKQTGETGFESPDKILTNNPMILSTKRKPKPIRHPDFEMEYDNLRFYGRQAGTPTKKKKDSVAVTSVNNRPSKSNKHNNSSVNKEVQIKEEPLEPQDESLFQPIITTRRQKRNNPYVDSDLNKSGKSKTKR